MTFNYRNFIKSRHDGKTYNNPMYKVIVVLFATFFIASATKAGAQDTTAVNQDTSSVRNAFTLEQCVEIAFKNNADVKLKCNKIVCFICRWLF